MININGILYAILVKTLWYTLYLWSTFGVRVPSAKLLAVMSTAQLMHFIATTFAVVCLCVFDLLIIVWESVAWINFLAFAVLASVTNCYTMLPGLAIPYVVKKVEQRVRAYQTSRQENRGIYFGERDRETINTAVTLLADIQRTQHEQTAEELGRYMEGGRMRREAYRNYLEQQDRQQNNNVVAPAIPAQQNPVAPQNPPAPAIPAIPVQNQINNPDANVLHDRAVAANLMIPQYGRRVHFIQ